MQDPVTLRTRLRADLVAAMRARQADAVAALRTALAAIDNAEAVDASESATGVVSGRIAGAQPGVGSTEARRRDLSSGEVRAILTGQIEERVAAAGLYEAKGQNEAAGRLRREADVLMRYLNR